MITLQVPEPTELEILPEEMNLDIVYEDDENNSEDDTGTKLNEEQL